MKNLSIGVIVLLIFFALSTIIIVDETEQIVILQFGKPVKTLKDPGLNWKLPAPLQTSNSFEKRLLEYDVPPEEILSRDKKSLIIDNYTAAQQQTQIYVGLQYNQGLLIDMIYLPFQRQV